MLSTWYNKMNRYVNQYAEKAVTHMIRPFPASFQDLIRCKFQAEAKIMTLCLFSQLAYYSPLTFTALPLLSSLTQNSYSYLRSCQILSLYEKTICCLTTALLTGSYAFDLRNCSKEENCFPSLFHTNSLIFASLLTTAGYLSERKKEKEEEEKRKQDHEKILCEIEFLEDNLKKLDTFVMSNPALYQLISNYAKTYKNEILEVEEIPTVCDSADLIEQKFFHVTKRNRLQDHLEQKLVFIRQHPELLESFYQHMQQNGESVNATISGNLQSQLSLLYWERPRSSV